VLVLSLPRSGSSWVGRTLGQASDAMYLREPFTQGSAAINRRVVFDPAEAPDLEPTLRRLADSAFRGVPSFRSKVVHYPEQWALADRRRRRVVLKEVNPRAAGWFLARYRPKVVFLVRRPAAVCWSAQRKGWLGSSVESWRARGLEDAETLRRAWDALRGRPDVLRVEYESLCRDPLTGFSRLYAFSGLDWDDAAAARVLAEAEETPGKADAWRSAADPAAVRALRESYRSVWPAWFREADDWRMAGDPRRAVRSETVRFRADVAHDSPPGPHASAPVRPGRLEAEAAEAGPFDAEGGAS
jgi:hypothetical protein